MEVATTGWKPNTTEITGRGDSDST